MGARPRRWLVQEPQIRFAVAPTLENVIPPVGSPGATALARCLIPTGEQRMQMAAVCVDLPHGGGAISGIKNVKTQPATIRRKTEAEDEAVRGCQLPRLAPVSARNVNIRAIGENNLASIAGPSRRLSRGLIQALRRSARQRHRPKGERRTLHIFWVFECIFEAENEKCGAVASNISNENVT